MWKHGAGLGEQQEDFQCRRHIYLCPGVGRGPVLLGNCCAGVLCAPLALDAQWILCLLSAWPGDCMCMHAMQIKCTVTATEHSFFVQYTSKRCRTTVSSTAG